MIQALTLQKLPPDQAKLCLTVKKFWSQFKISPTKNKQLKILLALSGGADSTAMAVILHILRHQLDISLCAVTIDHNIREESQEDVRFVENLCQQLDIVLIIQDADVKKFAQQKKIGLEEAGRIKRYQILEEIRAKTGADYITVAHNADDLCEDVLMRLCRGTGWPGLGGMPALDPHRKLLRPLIQVQRRQIETFLHALGMEWRTDISNSCQTYTRNRFRHTITPCFHAENPKFNKAISSLWKMARIDAEFWDEYIQVALKNEPWEILKEDNGIEIRLGYKLLASIPKAARIRLLSKAIKTAKSEGNNIRANFLFAIEQTWANGTGGKIFYLTKDLQVYIKQKRIYIRHSIQK